ncbi:hypothetical protein Aduo_018727 [Ancylostoma duodenale]
MSDGDEVIYCDDVEVEPASSALSNAENELLVELYCNHRAEYHSKLSGSSRNGPTPQDPLASEWAHEITSLGEETRSASQIKQKIYDLKKRALREIEKEKKERMRTAGGRYKSPYIPSCLRKLMDHVGADDSTVGIPSGAESGRTSGTDVDGEGCTLSKEQPKRSAPVKRSGAGFGESAREQLIQKELELAELQLKTEQINHETAILNRDIARLKKELLLKKLQRWQD